MAKQVKYSYYSIALEQLVSVSADTVLVSDYGALRFYRYIPHSVLVHAEPPGAWAQLMLVPEPE